MSTFIIIYFPKFIFFIILLLLLEKNIYNIYKCIINIELFNFLTKEV
jgi:hypothetical protein